MPVGVVVVAIDKVMVYFIDCTRIHNMIITNDRKHSKKLIFSELFIEMLAAETNLFHSHIRPIIHTFQTPNI